MPSLEMALVVAQGSEAATPPGNDPSSETRYPKQTPSLSRQNPNPNVQGTAQGSSSTSKTRWQNLFHSLPDEIRLNIMAHLVRDPVSQICLGLTARRWYAIFHEIIDQGQLYVHPGRKYDIKRFPFDLRMQAAVDESHVLYGWCEWGYMRDATCVQWQRSLGELLRDEKTLWGDLWYCGLCVKYKPEEAFGTFALEEKVGKEDPVFLNVGKGEGGYRSWCRRCRACSLLIDWEGREGVFEVHGNAFEDRESLGLIRVGEEGRARELWIKMICNCDEDPEILEAWDEVFEKMGI
ncbi:hypothetical protein BKA65DRAFT_245852 [Rhexocercosporidium sp. MPI-PUGE-AT-0058]|nr:hypothetical protein BKA65DRAFT_245852 [Rhexocercosporidium sp. MPI-PUGE-AT-0058]